MSLNSIESQKKRYNREAFSHDRFHQSTIVQEYRNIFIRQNLFSNTFENLQVLDGMCASGVETGYLISLGAHVEGLDISEANCLLFEKNWGRPCKVASIHSTGFPSEHFDAIYICGGLHHILPYLEQTLNEIHRILKKGGRFYFVEPNKKTVLNYLRKIWYLISPKFTKEENAIDYDKELKVFLDIGFEEEKLDLGGNIGYLLVGQMIHLRFLSMFVIPLKLPIFYLENFLNRFKWFPKLFFMGIWRKI